MNVWRHFMWKRFLGTWLIASKYLSDEEIEALIKSNPLQYGDPLNWDKIR